jgi:two-component system chemotaxis response regulator CheY
MNQYINKISVIDNLTLLEQSLMVIERSGLAENTPMAMVRLLTKFADRVQASLNNSEYQQQYDLLNLMKIGFRKITDQGYRLSTRYLDLCCCGTEKVLHTIVDGQGIEQLADLKEEFLAYLSKSEDSIPKSNQGPTISTQEVSEQSKECRILIIEDEIISRRLLKKNLNIVGPCDEASSASEGLISFMMAIEEGNPYELIFLDIMMPGMDGLNLLRLLRGVEEEHHVPSDKATKVVMVSGRKDKNAILGSFKNGCNGYLVKPIEPAKLSETLDNLYSKDYVASPDCVTSDK